MITNSYFCHTHFAPAGFDAAGHMLEVIVIEKDTLQVVNDHIDGPIRGVPDLLVIGTPGCGNPDVNMGFLEIWDAAFCLLSDGFVDHSGPVLFRGTGQFL